MSATLTLDTAALGDTTCGHCGQPTLAGSRFCCAGCATAYDTIHSLGLGSYYRQRLLDPERTAPRPSPLARHDLARHITTDSVGVHRISLAVDGLHCGACVWLIESVLGRDPAVLQGRVNMTSRHLRLAWRGEPALAETLVARIEALGYRLVPFNPASLAAASDRTGKELIRALAVAGFAATNVMMFSAAIWAGLVADMGPGTRQLLYILSGLVAVPAVAYAGRPFFRSAFAALRQWRTNMDVPVSIGVLLVTAISVLQTFRGAEHAYFDSAVSLLFFLLLGRLLDHRARARARATAEQLLALRTADVNVVAADGTIVSRAQEHVAAGETVLAGMGERIGVDGILRDAATLDTSLVTGESLPVSAQAGAQVFAGTLNLGAPITITATATGNATLLAECAKLIEAAEARRGRFVVLADRIARRYAPAVHLTALTTFLYWVFVAGVPVTDALLTACAVLIITCPCALALAVPAVQVLATSTLFRRGILLKSPTALERLAEIDTVVFDKTGTLTDPALALRRTQGDAPALAEAAALALNSRHPLARALAVAAGPSVPLAGVREFPGEGLEAPDGRRLGRAEFTGAQANGDAPELFLSRPGQPPVRFAFAETLRPDAVATIAALRHSGVSLHLLSGDRAEPVAAVAAELGIADARARCSPLDKAAALEGWRAAGHHVLMVGDGLNDGPSLAAAHVSISPASAADISQTLADVVFQGSSLAPVAAVLAIARRAKSVMRQNIGLALTYNVIMVPLAATGHVTPWVAAAAMSSSSLLVMANSFRVQKAAK